jgi:hypothetical protein
MTSDKLLGKLAKMVAARDGEAAIGNEAAADAFASAINRLLLDHDLTMAEVDFAASVKEDPIVELHADLAKFGVDRKKARVGWQEALARVVATAHMCKFMVIMGSNAIIFVGTKEHATVAEYAYGTLVAATEKMSWKAYNKMFYGLKNNGGDVREARGYRAAWLSSFVNRMEQRFREAQMGAFASVAPGVGLMRVNQSLAKAQSYLDGKKTKKSAAARMDHSWNRAGHADGKAAANAVPLDRRGVGGSSNTTKKIGA